MKNIRKRNLIVLVTIVVGVIAVAALTAAAMIHADRNAVTHTKQETGLTVHSRPATCMTMIMTSRSIGNSGFGDWRQDYMEETSIKASGDYVKRTTYASGNIEIWAAENGEARQYWLNSKRSATSRPFKAGDPFLDENWLASYKNLRKENPLVDVLGHKTYVLRENTGNGSYIDNYVAPDVGEIVMSYRHSVVSDGIVESALLPVSIQVDQLNQELWNSVPKGLPIISKKHQ